MSGRTKGIWTVLAIVAGGLLALGTAPFAALGNSSPPQSPPQSAPQPIGLSAYLSRAADAFGSQTDGDGDFWWISVSARDGRRAAAGFDPAVPSGTEIEEGRSTTYRAWVFACDPGCRQVHFSSGPIPDGGSFSSTPLVSHLELSVDGCDIDVTWTTNGGLPSAGEGAVVDLDRARGAGGGFLSTPSNAAGTVCDFGLDTSSASQGYRLDASARADLDG